MENYKICFGCMKKINADRTICPNCGFDEKNYFSKRNPKTLMPGSRLSNNRYVVGKVLGIGGFGITYIGFDLNLQIVVAIKEYFPSSIASRNATLTTRETEEVYSDDNNGIYTEGLKRFVGEARTLAQFQKIEGIVSVTDFFYDNNTGYMIMEYLPGKSLKKIIDQREMPFSQQEVLDYMRPVLHALEKIHEANIIHRDITPDNLVMDETGKLKLIDFGSARSQMASNQNYTIQLKYGYAPLEQYNTNGCQGPWTDIYAICATIYYMMTHAMPQSATERFVDDQLLSLYELGFDVSKEFSNAIMAGMALKYADRFQSVKAFEAALYHSNDYEDDVTAMFDESNDTLTVALNESDHSPHNRVQNNKSQWRDTSDEDSDKGTTSSNKLIVILLGVLAGVILLGVIVFAILNIRSSSDDSEQTTSSPEATTAYEHDDNETVHESIDIQNTEETASTETTESAAYQTAIQYQYRAANPEQDILDYNGHAYMIINYMDGHDGGVDKFDDKDDLESYCETMHGYLAIVESKEENEALVNYLKEEGNITIGAFIGLKRANVKKKWKWMYSSEKLDSNDALWADGEPSNDESDKSVMIDLQEGGLWDATNFNANSRYAICEWDN